MNTKQDVSRRRFLKLAATTTLSSLAPPALAGVAGANDAIRLGLIGCGERGIYLASEILKRRKNGGRTMIAATCDVYEPRRQRAQAATGAEVHHRWQDLVERNDIDAVIIATPNHLHAPMAIAAMECGKDVYCEQPMALRIDEARAFRDGAVRWRRIVQIGAQETSAACWHLANDLLRSGAIGRPLWSQGSYTPSGPSRESNRAPRARPSLAAPDWAAFVGHAPRRSFDADRFFHWRKYWDYSAGVVTDSHYGKLAAILVAVGPAFPERVSAAGGIYLQDGREVPDCFVMTAEYAGGHTIVLASSMANAHGRPAVIRAEKATLELKDDAVTLVRESQPLVRNEALPAAPRSDHLDNWLTGIRTRRKCVCNENLGYCAMVAIAMAIQAYRTGRTMWFDPVREDLKPSPPPEPAPYGVTVA